MELNLSIRKARINDAETIADFNIGMAECHYKMFEEIIEQNYKFQ